MALGKKIKGTLYGVGVGPGDPKLMTFKAAQVIRKAPVLAYPMLEGGANSIAREIAKEHINDSKIEADAPEVIAT